MINIIVKILFFQLCTCVYFREAILMSDFRKEHGWVRLTSMYLDEGPCHLRTSIKFESHKIEQTIYRLSLVLLDQEQFKIEKEKHCSVISPLATTAIGYQLSKANSFAEDNQMREFETESSKRMVLVLRDCESTLINQYFQPQAAIVAQISLENQDSHLSLDHYFDLLNIPCQIALTIGLFKQLIKNRKDPINASDINSLIFNVLALHLVSLSFHGISTLSSTIFGHSIDTLPYLCLILNAAVECCLILLVLNLSFGWKTTNKEQIFASQLLYRVVVFIIWATLYLLKRARDDTSYLDYSLLSLKAIVFLMSIYGSYHNKNRHQRYSIEFHYRLLICASVYLLSGYLENKLSRLFVIQVESVIQISFFCLRNSAIIIILSRLLVAKNNLYQKIALSKKSFID